MINPLHEKHARLLVDYCGEVQPGDRVSVSVSTLGEPLARAVYREVLRAGGLPYLRLEHPEAVEDLLDLASDELFVTEPSVELAEAELIDVSLRIIASHNMRSLQGSDKARYARYAARLKPVQDIYRTRATRWNITLHPTEATAQDAGVSLDAFERLVYDAMFLYDDEPTERWREVRDAQAGLIERLAPADVWDMICDLRAGGAIYLDGELFQENGKLVTP